MKPSHIPFPSLLPYLLPLPPSPFPSSTSPSSTLLRQRHHQPSFDIAKIRPSSTSPTSTVLQQYPPFFDNFQHQAFFDITINRPSSTSRRHPPFFDFIDQVSTPPPSVRPSPDLPTIYLRRSSTLPRRSTSSTSRHDRHQRHPPFFDFTDRPSRPPPPPWIGSDRSERRVSPTFLAAMAMAPEHRLLGDVGRGSRRSRRPIPLVVLRQPLAAQLSSSRRQE
ncbi:hypothetical protein CF327_g3475 [Tilletia walkeri]|uniref:Uncharacterized protein n=1 Tax=Tilletia walkeri TaxID=117179 RepID=A0A8X7N1R5_9BASI|nr:hypothetical protein CF327_g3475 [Tilletia walkeri]KAE8261405.1 hypothetical protein A4X09_0g7667 [Tilletia walkeri]